MMPSYMKQYMNYKQYKIGKYTTSNIELKDLAKAWVLVSLAFAIVLSGANFFSLTFAIFFLTAAIAVGSGFLFHEMAHKLVAQRYKCFAEFRADNWMLILAVLMSFFGFVFAAPGAVMIGGGHIDARRNGLISIAGSITNYVLAALFLLGNIIFPNIIFMYGFYINSWLGLFNMIPFSIFDGAKVFRWNIGAWIGMVAVGGFLVFITLGGIL